MATTTSDLSPGSGAYQPSFVGSAMAGQTISTNCDLQHHQLGEMVAPGTNTTTASYTSDMQSGYGDEQNMAPIYQQQHYQMQHPHQQQVYNPQQAGNLQSMLRAQKQQQQQQLQHQPPMDTLGGALIMQDLIQSRMIPGGAGASGGTLKRNSHYDPEFHIL